MCLTNLISERFLIIFFLLISFVRLQNRALMIAKGNSILSLQKSKREENCLPFYCADKMRTQTRLYLVLIAT
jgi:hypothetical protein